MPNNIKKILDEYVNGLVKLIGKKLYNVILYGSYARGTQSKSEEISDIDIMILVETDNEDTKKIQKDVLDYSYDFDIKYNILLSPIVESVSNYNARTKYIPFYKNIKKEGILLNG